MTRVPTVGIRDVPTQRAIRMLADDIAAVGLRIDGLDLSGDVSLPIATSDVTGLDAALGDLADDIATKIGGSGTSGTVPKWTGSGTLGDSQITDDGATVTIPGALKLSALTQGSVPFIGAAGVVTQDNAALFWDAALDQLVLTSAVGSPLRVVGSTTGGQIHVQNNNAAGLSDVYARDNAGVTRAAFGYGNSGHSDAHRAGRAYVSHEGVPFAITRSGGTDLLIDTAGAITVGAGTFHVDGQQLRVTNKTGVDGIQVNHALTGQTASHGLVAATNTGSYDTTAGAINAYAFYGDANGSRSAGGNTFRNYGARLRARGGIVNYALVCGEGDVILNDTGGGTTTIRGATTLDSNLTVAGNVSLGNATSDTIGFYGAAGVTRQSLTALTNNTGGTANDTIAAIPSPADTPASADALRDDLVANTLPALRDAISDLAAKVNQIRTVLVNLGLVA